MNYWCGPMASSPPSRMCARLNSLMPFLEIPPGKFCVASLRSGNGSAWVYLSREGDRRHVNVDIEQLVAIDVHTHAEVSQRIPDDPLWRAIQEASANYFKDEGPRPTIPEIAAYYRERKMACVIFPVDIESTTGLIRVPNDEVAEVAAANPDVLIPFASIDPAKGKMGAREARRLIEHFGVRGFKFHPSLQAFYPNDRSAYLLY